MENQSIHEDAPHLWFETELRPHRSLTRRGFRRLMMIALAVTALGGVRAWMIGAWPVTAFLVLDLLLLWGAFHLNYISGRAREIIRLTTGTLEIEYHRPFAAPERTCMQPYWTRVDVRHPDSSRMEVRLTDRGMSAVVGTFLSRPERDGLADALKKALHRFRHTLPPT